MKFAVIYGSVRTERQGIKAARFMVSKLKERGHEVVLIDPEEFRLPMLDYRYHEYEKGKAPEDMEKLAGILEEQDGYVVVTAEYNHAPPPALTNLLDHYVKEYLFKPSAIVSYSSGSFGGVRAAVQLRALVDKIGMSSIPTMFPIPNVQDSFDESGKALDEAYDTRVKKFLDEFEWYASALREAREKGTPDHS